MGNMFGWNMSRPIQGKCPEPHIAYTLTLSIDITIADADHVVAFKTWQKNNKCIGDDTKPAARQSLDCIKNKQEVKVI